MLISSASLLLRMPPKRSRPRTRRFRQGRGLRSLAPLIGTWKIHGRTLGPSPLSIRGTTRVGWSTIAGFQEHWTVLRVGRQKIRALEIVGYDPNSGTFPSWVFSEGAAIPLAYRWEIHGRAVVHAGLGATFRGQFSDDRRVLTGGWRPDSGGRASPGSQYDATMTRVASDGPRPSTRR